MSERTRKLPPGGPPVRRVARVLVLSIILLTLGAGKPGAGTEKGETAGEQVVARIGGGRITMSDLDRQIEADVAAQFGQMAGRMTPEQVRKQKAAMLKWLHSPRQKQRQLTRLVIEELLYRRACEIKLAEKPEVRALLARLRRKVLTTGLIEKELADRIKITHADLRAYYASHRERFVLPERADISYILVKDQAAAEAVLKRFKAGEKFADLVAKYSLYSVSRGKRRAISATVSKNQPDIRAIGDSGEAIKAIFATRPGSLCEEPVRGRLGLHVIMVRARKVKRQERFDEAREQVRRALRAEKEKEVKANLIKRLRAEYNVVIHYSAFKAEKPPAAGPPRIAPGKSR